MKAPSVRTALGVTVVVTSVCLMVGHLLWEHGGAGPLSVIGTVFFVALPSLFASWLGIKMERDHG